MLWGPLALSHCLGLPVLEQRVLAPESAFEGCQPVETSSSPSLWTAVQAQCQGAGVIQGVPDAGAQKGRKSDGCRPWPVDGVDIFSTMFSMPWIPVWPFRSHKSLGQRRCTSSSRQHAPRAPRPRRPAPELKLYYRVAVRNAERHWHKNRLVVLWNIIEGPDRNLHMQTSIIFFIKNPVICTGKRQYLQQLTLDICM